VARLLTPEQLEATSTCPDWTVLDVLRHVRSNVALWNEHLDRDQQGLPPVFVFDTAKLSADQLRDVDKLRGLGLDVLDMTEENNRRIAALGGQGRDRLTNEFRSDGLRYSQRIQEKGSPDLVTRSSNSTSTLTTLRWARRGTIAPPTPSSSPTSGGRTILGFQPRTLGRPCSKHQDVPEPLPSPSSHCEVTTSAIETKLLREHDHESAFGDMAGSVS
jgi:hypothetical protein